MKLFMKIFSIIVLFFFVIQSQASQIRSKLLLASNKIENKSESTKQTASTNRANSQTSFPVPPKIKDDEYAIFIEDSYLIFKTKKFEALELSEICFKSSKPKCEAYEFAQIKPKDLSIKVPGMNNKSAIHCEAVGGRNLLALDNKNNQYNFCRFSDGSLVNSWSMNYKHFPQSIIK